MEGKNYLRKAEAFIDKYPSVGEAWEEDITWYGAGDDDFYDALYNAISDEYGDTIKAGEDQYMALSDKAIDELDTDGGDEETIEYWVAKELYIKEHEIPENEITDVDVEAFNEGKLGLREAFLKLDMNSDDPALVNMYDACMLNKEQKYELAESIKNKNTKSLVESLTKFYKQQNKF